MRRIHALILVSLSVAILSAGCNLYTDLDRPAGDPVDPDADTVLDAGDMGGDATNDDDGGCTPQTDEEFCNVQGADCGEVVAFDNCGSSRPVNCGNCTDGSTCGERQDNVCGCPCEIDGTCVAEGAINPDNPCEVCDSAADPMGWTAQPGQACTNDDLCAEAAACTDQGICETTATIDCTDELGECVDAMCDPVDGVCKGDPVADDTPCTDDGLSCTSDVCIAGTCEHPVDDTSCLVDGVCLSDGESPDGNSCTTCVLDAGVASLVDEAMGTSCGPDLACATATCDGAGACVVEVVDGACAIDGTCYADGEMNDTNRCEFCVTTTSQTEWTAEPVGTECRSPNCICKTSGGGVTCLRPNDGDCN